MKTLKVTKKMLKMHPADLLIELGAVGINQRDAFPEHVYLSKKDSKELRKNLEKSAKEKCPGMTKHIISYSVGVDMLNYGPNEALAEAIRPGYVLVDEEAIERAKS